MIRFNLSRQAPQLRSLLNRQPFKDCTFGFRNEIDTVHGANHLDINLEDFPIVEPFHQNIIT